MVGLITLDLGPELNVMGPRTIKPCIRSDIDIEDTIVFSIGLARGGDKWLSYDSRRLSSELRQEWDALEAILLALAEDSHLYILGYFENAPIPVRQKRRLWDGAHDVGSRSELHEILNENLVGRYSYVISATRLAPDFARRPLESRSCNEFFGLCLATPGVYCCFVEDWDRTYVDCGCRTALLPRVMATMKQVLGKLDLELQPISPGDAGNAGASDDKG